MATKQLLTPESDFLLYTTPGGKIKLEIFIKDETIWLSQEKIARLFGVDRSVVTKHLKNIFESRELEENSVRANFAHTATDGKSYQTKFYNLDAIISVGYRVNSAKATQFRIWATERLKEYIIKGFTMDDERLKDPRKVFGKDYFEELLERIREIRASERRFYQKITDIYALSADYDKNSDTTKTFFAMVQNKLHWAIAGKTAAEIIYTEADAKKAFMGLKTWKNAPNKKILKSDIATAKNYLSEKHIAQLNRLVSAYLDLAEDRATRGIVMNMQDWSDFLNKFLTLSDYPTLTHKGKVTAEQARLKAETEYEKFRVEQDREYVSDFDRVVKKLAVGGKKINN